MQNNALIRVDALNLETSINQPQFKALLSKGWQVAGMIPVDDEGKPVLIFILHPPKAMILSRTMNWILLFICLQSVLLFLILIKDYVFKI